MTTFSKYILTICAFLLSVSAFAQIDPSETYVFDERDGITFLMDEYVPSSKSQTTIDGKNKPSIIFLFGGGFVGGRRDQNMYREWFEKLCDNGYHIFAIDYRLGLKGHTEKGMERVKATVDAIRVGMEDLFSATNYILQNADMLGVEPDNIVISGSSAGAIITLQAEWEICNGGSTAAMLPEGFNYAGVMSFSGAILSGNGKVKYKTTPCPQLLCHGTADKVVNYKQIKLLKWNFCGSSSLVSRIKQKKGIYQIYRYEGYGHEIAASMKYLVDEQVAFLENVVVKKENRTSDTLVKDSDIPAGSKYQSRKDIYGKK